MLILVSVLLSLTVGCKHPLSFDAHGDAHGTGEQIRARMHYVNGVADGDATTYDSVGNVAKVETYSHGKLIGRSGSPETLPAE